MFYNFSVSAVLTPLSAYQCLLPIHHACRFRYSEIPPHHRVPSGIPFYPLMNFPPYPIWRPIIFRIALNSGLPMFRYFNFRLPADVPSAPQYRSAASFLFLPGYLPYSYYTVCL